MASIRDIDLPDGLVRDIIALAFAVTVIQQTIVGALSVDSFLALAGPIIGFYAGQKAAETAVAQVTPPGPALEEELGAPSVPDPKEIA